MYQIGVSASDAQTILDQSKGKGKRSFFFKKSKSPPLPSSSVPTLSSSSSLYERITSPSKKITIEQIKQGLSSPKISAQKLVSLSKSKLFFRNLKPDSIEGTSESLAEFSPPAVSSPETSSSIETTQADFTGENTIAEEPTSSIRSYLKQKRVKRFFSNTKKTQTSLQSPPQTSSCLGTSTIDQNTTTSKRRLLICFNPQVKT